MFDIHKELDWDDNLIRLVEATNNIKPIAKIFEPDFAQLSNIYNSIDKATHFIQSENFTKLLNELKQRCEKYKNEILIASRIENNNIRGRLIESLINTDGPEHEKIVEQLKNLEQELPVYDTRNGSGDFCRIYDNEETFTDIKTKIIYLKSNPKAYNIDKFLKQMADPSSIFFFYFIGIDEKKIFNSVLCSVYHKELI